LHGLHASLDKKLEQLVLSSLPSLFFSLETLASVARFGRGEDSRFFFPPLFPLLFAFLSYEFFGFSWFRVFSNLFCHRLVRFIPHPPKLTSPAVSWTSCLLYSDKSLSPQGFILGFQFSFFGTQLDRPLITLLLRLHRPSCSSSPSTFPLVTLAPVRLPRLPCNWF
jgi:hypothetical protein